MTGGSTATVPGPADAAFREQLLVRYRAFAAVEGVYDDLERALGVGLPPEPGDIALLAPRLGRALKQLLVLLDGRLNGSPTETDAAVLARARRVLGEPFPHDPPEEHAHAEVSRPAHRPSVRFSTLFYGPRTREAMARAEALTTPVSAATGYLRRLAMATLDVLDIVAGDEGWKSTRPAPSTVQTHAPALPASTRTPQAHDPAQPKELSMKIETLTPDEFTRPLAVVTGGWSQERDRALLSGKTVAEALGGLGIEYRVLDSSGDPDTLIAGLRECELALLAIAGRGAEDGRLQGLLESIGVPYTGSGVLASAAGMHKTTAKRFAAARDVAVPPYTSISSKMSAEDEAEHVAERCGLPVILKPVSEGGSIGLVLARTPEELIAGINASAGVETMAERYIEGRSVSVGVLEDPRGGLHVLPTLETVTAGGIYSYEAKREQGLTTYHCPARVTEAERRELEIAARRAHRGLRCHGYSRHDFVVSAEGFAVWLEVNTLPGLSRQGNFARMADAAGFSYEQLLAHIVRTARVDRRAQP